MNRTLRLTLLGLAVVVVLFAAVAIVVAYSDAGAITGIVALAFSIVSFWWLNAREGRFEVAQPHAYAFSETGRLRLPLTFYNRGAKALIVANLRLRVEDDPTRTELEWITTRDRLRPESKDEFAFATPFAVEGRSTREVFAEFGDDEGWSPPPGSYRRLRLEAIVHPRTVWKEVGKFDWWAPPLGVDSTSYLTHRNEPPR